MSSIEDWRRHVSGPDEPADGSRSSVQESGPRSERSSNSADVSHYRQETLWPKGIIVKESEFPEEVLPPSIFSHVKRLDAAKEILSGRSLELPLRHSFKELEEKLGTAAAGAHLPQARLGVEAVVTLHDRADRKSEWQRCLWENAVYMPLEREEKIVTMRTMKWDTKLQPWTLDGQTKFIPRTQSLGAVEPDFAIGLFEPQISNDIDFDRAATSPFSAFWEEHKMVAEAGLLCLGKRYKGMLHPQPVLGDSLVYPSFAHEVESGLRGLNAATIQLAKSLGYALDQQEELRLLAGATVEERMPVFGAASSGALVQLWYGAYVGNRIYIVNSRRLFDMRLPSNACAYIAFTEALHLWFLDTYAPRIVAWLDRLWLKTITDTTGMGSRSVRNH